MGSYQIFGQNKHAKKHAPDFIDIAEWYRWQMAVFSDAEKHAIKIFIIYNIYIIYNKVTFVKKSDRIGIVAPKKLPSAICTTFELFVRK